MADQKNFHMTPAEFREYGHTVVNWIAEYYEKIESLPVLSRVQPGQVRSSLPGEPPIDREAFDDILKDVGELILPGLTHWQSPNFVGFMTD